MLRTIAGIEYPNDRFRAFSDLPRRETQLGATPVQCCAAETVGAWCPERDTPGLSLGPLAARLARVGKENRRSYTASIDVCLSQAAKVDSQLLIFYPQQHLCIDGGKEGVADERNSNSVRCQ